MTDELQDFGDDQQPTAGADEGDLDQLLEFLHRSRGFDFTGYKRASLARRIRRRMQIIGIDAYAEYLDHLEVHPDEYPQLFNLLLINVTSFFRDPAAWDAVASRLPSVIDMAGDRPIRVWSAGCSSGEEPFTLAMILHDALGADAFNGRVKIYATDVDEDALAHARQAAYPRKALEAVPPRFAEKYFTQTGSSFTFNKELRRAVIFGRHDLVQDAPIPRVDILTCRNALMYFNAETQTRILQRLQFALNPTGLLFLGKAEMLLTHADLFVPADLKLRLFTRASKSVRLRDKAPLGSSPLPSLPADEARMRVLQAALESSPASQVVVDTTGRLAFANHRAARHFNLAPTDIGRPFHDLELSYRPAELRSCIDKVRLERRSVQLKEVERILTSGDKTFLDIDVTPLVSEQGVFVGTQVSFTDVTQSHRLQMELRRTNLELEAAHEELQSTSEELETTNEELQSTVEELETTNEELQSTNEELETMNEELQSTNEELQTINEELRQRGTELNEMNSFFGSVLGSLHSGITVLDSELRVKTWNERMEEMWGARASEVEGKHFLNLDIGLPIDQLAVALRSGLATGEQSEQSLTCTNRRGKTVQCKVTVMSLRGDQNRGVIVLVEEVG